MQSSISPTSFLLASVTGSVAVHAVAPSPICAGVLGITLTIASCPSADRISAIAMPAMIDTTICERLSNAFVAGITSANCCGFTEMISASCAGNGCDAERIVVTPYRSLSSWSRSWTMSITVMSTSMPPFTMPAIMASAMTPPPRNATLRRIVNAYPLVNHARCSTAAGQVGSHPMPRLVASATASLIASTMLTACALFCPAMSNAVPWSTDVRMNGMPRFTETDSSKPCTLMGMCP